MFSRRIRNWGLLRIGVVLAGGQHIDVQSGRQPLVAYFEGASREEFDPWVDAL